MTSAWTSTRANNKLRWLSPLAVLLLTILPCLTVFRDNITYRDRDIRLWPAFTLFVTCFLYIDSGWNQGTCSITSSYSHCRPLVVLLLTVLPKLVVIPLRLPALHTFCDLIAAQNAFSRALEGSQKHYRLLIYHDSHHSLVSLR